MHFSWRSCWPDERMGIVGFSFSDFKKGNAALNGRRNAFESCACVGLWILCSVMEKNNFAGSLGKCNAFVPNRSCRAETIRKLPDWGLTQKPYSMRNSESIRRLSSSVTNAFSSFCAPQKRKATTEPQHTEIACDNPRQPSLKPKKTQIVIKFKPKKILIKIYTKK